MAEIIVAPSGGDFDNLDAALANATASDRIFIVGDWTSAGADTTDGSVFEDDNVVVKAVGDARTDGRIQAKNYQLKVNPSTECLRVDSDGNTIDGVIIILDTGSSSDEAIDVNMSFNETVTIKNCVIIALQQTNQQDGIYTNNATQNIVVENTIIANFNRGGITSQSNDGQTIDVNSCAFYNNGHQSDAAFPGGGITFHNGSDNNTINVHNSWFIDNDNSSPTASGAFREGGTVSGNTWGISNVAEDDGTANSLDSGGANQNTSATLVTSAGAGSFEIIVNDTTKNSTNLDLRLKDDSGNDAQDQHTTATAEGLTIPSRDIAHGPRPWDTSHDLGPFEVNSLPVIQSRSEQNETTNTTSTTITAPSGIADDDLLVIIIAIDTANTGISFPAGFTTIHSENFDSATSLSIAHKVASSESGNYTVSWTNSEQSSAVMLRIDGIVTSDPVQDPNESATGTTSAGVGTITPSTATDTDDSLVFVAHSLASTTSMFPEDAIGDDDYRMVTAFDNAQAGGQGIAVQIQGINSAATPDACGFEVDTVSKFIAAWFAARSVAPVGGANPRGPLGHPLHGPLGGPI